MKRYNNYHKHDHISSIFTPDSNSKIEDYAKRAIELNESNIFTTNHGSGGDIFEARTIADKYNLNCKFGIEGYIVANPLEKDKSNNHIVLIPKTNIARKKLNKANSRANIEGFYYRPRLFLDDLLNNFDNDEIYITTACCAGLLKDDKSINELFYPLYEKFGKNLLLEVQSHTQAIQLSINEKAIKYQKELGLYLIGSNDSHYIYPEQYKERLELLKGKGISYDDEDTFVLDYPNYDTMVERFQRQGVLNNKQILQAMETTLIFDTCENINIDKTIKMPTIYQNLNDDEKILLLKNKANDGFKKVCKEDIISKEKRPLYKQELVKEMKVIEETKEIHTADYFLLNTELIDIAINKYNGVLTRTGRGSCGAFLLNKILGITQIDRLSVDLPLYSERFMSTARLLENHALPDIDMNVVEQEPFVKASRDLLGEKGCYPMIAYGTMKESESFRNVCRSAQLEYDEYNEIAKNIEQYHDDKKWGKYIQEANKYIGTIISASVHPCAHILLNGDIEEEIGVVKIGNNICAMITSNEADDWKYLKNDYLIVSVWDIIAKTFKMIDKPIITIKELLDNIDDRVWKLFELGMTCTLNQVDGDWATSLLKQYKPHSMEELAKFVSAIRPSFNSFRDTFIKRQSYTTGSEHLDKLFHQTDSMITFQENIMLYFEWLGITPAESIGLIKKISKKKIKQSDFDNLENGMRETWIRKTGSIDCFQDTWDMMQSALSYSFNSPHGVATALDCLYCAYLKVNYPLEYYTVVLNIYEKDETKTARLLNEMNYFNLSLKNVKFKYSTSRYSYDKSTNTIYKGISSIKNLNSKCGLELYALKDNHYDTFFDLLNDVKNTSVNSRQLDILIKIDFFEEYGDINSLLEAVDIYNKYSSCKQIKKEKINDFELSIIRQCSGKESDKMFKDIDNKKLIKIFYDNMSVVPTTIYDKISYQIQLLGYTDIIDSTFDELIYAVESTETNQWGTVFASLYCISDGKREQYKVDKKYYKEFPFEVGDVLQTVFRAKEKRKKVNDKWVSTEEYETILVAWLKQN